MYPVAQIQEQAREILRRRHRSIRTEEVYLQRIQQSLLFHGERHPSLRGPAQIRAYLSHLAVEGQVAASTQNVALHALVLLYRDVLQVDLPPGSLENIERAKRPQRLPVAFTRAEVTALLAQREGTPHRMASLL